METITAPKVRKTRTITAPYKKHKTESKISVTYFIQTKVKPKTCYYTDYPRKYRKGFDDSETTWLTYYPYEAKPLYIRVIYKGRISLFKSRLSALVREGGLEAFLATPIVQELVSEETKCIKESLLDHEAICPEQFDINRWYKDYERWYLHPEDNMTYDLINNLQDIFTKEQLDKEPENPDLEPKDNIFDCEKILDQVKLLYYLQVMEYKDIWDGIKSYYDLKSMSFFEIITPNGYCDLFDYYKIGDLKSGYLKQCSLLIDNQADTTKIDDFLEYVSRVEEFFEKQWSRSRPI